MSTDTKPEALRLADKLEIDGLIGDHRFAQNQRCTQAAMELRRLHHENADLRAQLEAIGAGGVEPLRKRHDHIEVSLRMVTKGGRSMTTQHAPGPWTANTQTTRIQVNSRNVTVAHVMGIDAKAQADAYLMAAAPELLDALRDLTNQFLERGVFMDPHHPDRIALAAAEAAIAKAEGV